MIASGEIGFSGGIVEISCHRLAHMLAGIHEPEDDEERHHRGDEVGVGDLPRAAVVAVRGELFCE